MRYIAVGLLFLFKINVFAQEFKPFFVTPYSEYCSDIIGLDNDRFIAIHSFVPIDTLGNYLSSNDIGGFAFTRINLYNSKGIKINTLEIEGTDSTIFLTQQIEKLQDGRYIIVGGELNINTENYNLFYGVFEESLSSFDFFKVFDSPTNSYPTAFVQYDNSDLVFYTNRLIQYTLDGVFVKEAALLSNNTCSSVIPNNFYYFKDKICIKCGFIVGLTQEKYIVIDTNFNIQSHILNSFPELHNGNIANFSTIGKKIDDNKYVFIANVWDTLGLDTVHPVLLQIDSNHEWSPFFYDMNQTINYNSYYHGYNIDFKNKDHIYAAFNITKRDLVLYSMNSSGNQNWKKYITLNYELETNNRTGFLNASFATNDKGYMISFTVKGLNNSSDVYYYKVDSLGNPSDFATGLNDDLIQINDFLLYPNPVKNTLNIETGLNGNFIVRIYNTIGSVVKVVPFKSSISFETEDLLRGTYLYSIKDINGTEIQSGTILKE